MITKILKFGATWCNPCRVVEKSLEKIDIPHESFDVDEDEEMTLKYNIKGIPVLIYMNENGEEVGRTIGAISAGAIQDKIKGFNENLS